MFNKTKNETGMNSSQSVNAQERIFTSEEVLSMIQFPKEQIRLCGIVRRVTPKPEMSRVFGDISYGGAVIGFSLPIEQAPKEDAPIVIAGMLSLRHDLRSSNHLYRYGIQITGRIVDTFLPYVPGTDIELKRSNARISFDEIFRIRSFHEGDKLNVLALCSQTAKRDMEATFSSLLPQEWPINIIYQTIPFSSEQAASNAISLAIQSAQPDILVFTRGGGATDEIAVTANSPLVVKTLLDAQIPIYSAVGHDHDVSLADKYSDESFHTPTALAASLVQAWERHWTHRRTAKELDALKKDFKAWRAESQKKELQLGQSLWRARIAIACLSIFGGAFAYAALM